MSTQPRIQRKTVIKIILELAFWAFLPGGIAKLLFSTRKARWLALAITWLVRRQVTRRGYV